MGGRGSHLCEPQRLWRTECPPLTVNLAQHTYTNCRNTEEDGETGQAHTEEVTIRREACKEREDTDHKEHHGDHIHHRNCRQHRAEGSVIILPSHVIAQTNKGSKECCNTNTHYNIHDDRVHDTSTIRVWGFLGAGGSCDRSYSRSLNSTSTVCDCICSLRGHCKNTRVAG